MVYSRSSPGQASSGPHLWHQRTGFAHTIVQKATGVAEMQKHASRQPSLSQRRQILSFWQQPAFRWPMLHTSLPPSWKAGGSLFTKSTPSGSDVLKVASQTSRWAHTSMSMQYWSPSRQSSGWRAITCTPSQVMLLPTMRSRWAGPQHSLSGWIGSQQGLQHSDSAS